MAQRSRRQRPAGDDPLSAGLAPESRVGDGAVGDPEDVGLVRQFGRRLYDISDRLSLEAVTDRDPNKWEWFAKSASKATSFREIAGLAGWLGGALSEAVRKDGFDDWMALCARASTRTDLEIIMQRAEKSQGNIIDWRLVKFQWQNPGRKMPTPAPPPPQPVPPPAAAKAVSKPRTGEAGSPSPVPYAARRKQKTPQVAALDVAVPPKAEGRKGRTRKPNPKYADAEEDEPEPPRAKKPRVQGPDSGRGVGKKPPPAPARKKAQDEDAANVLLMVMGGTGQAGGGEGEAPVGAVASMAALEGAIEPVELSEGALAAAGMRWRCRRAAAVLDASTSGPSLAGADEAEPPGRPEATGVWAATGEGTPKRFLCRSCRNPVQVRGGLRPAFLCARCPAFGGRPRHAAHAFAEGAAAGPAAAALWGVEEALDVVLRWIRAPRAAAVPPEVRGEGRKGPVQLQLPPPVSREAAVELARAAAEASRRAVLEAPGKPTVEEVEIGGRCKCGKRVSPSHPPCKSELTVLTERFRRRYGDEVSDAPAAGGPCPAAGAGEGKGGVGGGEGAGAGGGSGAGAPGGRSTIQLNEAAVELGVARRRLYDIINVLEPVEVVVRTGKLSYEWRGTRELGLVLERLLMDTSLDLPEGAMEVEAVGGEGGGKGEGRGDVSRDRASMPQSLWRLTRKFVRLLVMQPGPVQLAAAAAALVEREGSRAVHDERWKKSQAMLSVERRLYDIGSILSSIGLIEKTYVGRRQPAFSWAGFCHLLPPGEGASPEVRGDEEPKAPRGELECEAVTT